MKNTMSFKPDERKFYKFLIVFFLSCVFAYFAFIGISHLIRQMHPSSRVATVFGKPVSYQEYKRIQNYVLIQSRLRYGQFFDQFRPLLDIENETWETLILSREARNRDIRIPNDDVIDVISEMPIFQRNENFDPRLYRYAVREYFKAEPGEFEEAVRLQLITEKLLNMAVPVSEPSEDDLRELFENEHRKFNIHFALVPFPQKIPEPDPEELWEFFEKNALDYWSGPAVKVDFIRLDFPEDGGVQKEVENKYKAIGIYNDHIKNSNFYALGQKYNYPARESRFFSKEEPDPQIGLPPDQLESVFGLKPGELTTPIEREDGYLVVKMKQKRQARVKDFDDVRDDVIKAWKTEKAGQIALKQARSIAEKLQNQANVSLNDWISLSETHSLNPRSTEAISLEQFSINNQLTSRAKKTLVSNAAEDSVIPPLENASGYIIGFIETTEDPGISFEKTKTHLTDSWKTRERAEKIEHFLDQINTNARLTFTLTQ